MKLFDLYIRILKKQLWLYVIYLTLFFLFIVIGRKTYVGLAAVTLYYRYAVLAVMVLVMLTISAVTAVTSDTELFMRHQAAPVRLEILELTYVGADLLVMLFFWMLFFWMAVILCGEAAYSAEGLLMAVNLLSISLFSTAVGFMIGIFAKTAQSRGIVANLIALGLPFLGGSFELFRWGDSTVYILRSFTPVFWYQRALDEITVHWGKQESLENFAGYLGIQLIFALMVLTLGMMLAKQRKESAY